MIRRLVAWALSALIAANAIGTARALWLNPVARPVVERTADEARRALTRAMAGTVTAEWLVPRYEVALEAEALDDLALYHELADEYGVALPAVERARGEALIAAHEGTWQATKDCLACAYDILTCRTLAQLGACGLTVEMTPLGDLNALRRAGMDWASGDEVDGLEASLAIVGLAATGAVLVSGGGSATAKVGATAIRVGRRMKAVSAGFLRVLGEAVDGLVRWDRLSAAITSRQFDMAVDAAKFGRLRAMAEDAGVVYGRTSLAETVVLLRHVDDPADLRRVARTAEAMGPETRKSFAVLGKARTFRLLDRVTGLAAMAVGLVATLAAALAGMVLHLPLRIARGWARRR